MRFSFPQASDYLDRVDPAHLTESVKSDLFARMDALGAARTPFLFVLDHALERPILLPLTEIDPDRLRYDLRGVGNSSPPASLPGSDWGLQDLQPPPYGAYRKAFAVAHEAFLDGESYLLNLTASSRVTYAPRLSELFGHLQAPYRLWVDGPSCGLPGDGFLVFSPEGFVRIEGDTIATYPMKGSRRCRPDNAEAAAAGLLSDEKEAAEHVTVVDLLRNDLGRVADAVCVPRYRYLESIALPDGALLQTSSEIKGTLAPGWPARLGQILSNLLPAGSVTGAPKRRTCQRIAQAEAILGQERGFYTGIFGIFDGHSLDSAVMIRFLEDQGPHPDRPGFRHGLFKSGGGLTVQSSCEREFEELHQKVALPLPPVLLETIRLEDGVPQRLPEHQDRIDASHLDRYGSAPRWRLEEALSTVTDVPPGRTRLRLLHCRETWRIELHPYAIRRPAFFVAIEVGDLQYGHKYADRSGIDALRSQAAAHHGLDTSDPGWDILLTRDGFVLEAGYGAVAWRRNGQWFTPESPLLRSTRAAAYVAEGRMKPAPLRREELPQLEAIVLINAMVDLEDGVSIRLAAAER